MRLTRRGYAIGGAVLAVVVLAGWVLSVVRSASAATPEVVAAALAEAPIRVSDLTPRQRDILLKVEDPAFYEHRGVDLTTAGAGFTTITQGDVKLLYFPEGFRPGIAKIRQTLIAWLVFDRLVSKDDQLRIYLNRAYLGSVDGQVVHGFDQAARLYFGVPFSGLTEEQYISLVAMLPSPKNLGVRSEPARNAERSRRIRKLVDGQCRPAGMRDVYLDGCA